MNSFFFSFQLFRHSKVLKCKKGNPKSWFFFFNKRKVVLPVSFVIEQDWNYILLAMQPGSADKDQLVKIICIGFWWMCISFRDDLEASRIFLIVSALRSLPSETNMYWICWNLVIIHYYIIKMVAYYAIGKEKKRRMSEYHLMLWREAR